MPTLRRGVGLAGKAHAETPGMSTQRRRSASAGVAGPAPGRGKPAPASRPTTRQSRPTTARRSPSPESDLPAQRDDRGMPRSSLASAASGSPSVLPGPAGLVRRGVALISELGLTAQQRKALFAAGLAREFLADGLELLEDGSISKGAWSHDPCLPGLLHSSPDRRTEAPALPEREHHRRRRSRKGAASATCYGLLVQRSPGRRWATPSDAATGTVKRERLILEAFAAGCQRAPRRGWRPQDGPPSHRYRSRARRWSPSGRSDRSAGDGDLDPEPSRSAARGTPEARRSVLRGGRPEHATSG